MTEETRFCVRCGNPIPTVSRLGVPLTKANYRNRKYCGPECLKSLWFAQLNHRPCNQCGNPISRVKDDGTKIPNQAYLRLAFCSPTCKERSDEGYQKVLRGQIPVRIPRFFSRPRDAWTYVLDRILERL